jgi:hypothetical protein
MAQVPKAGGLERVDWAARTEVSEWYTDPLFWFTDPLFRSGLMV